MEVFHSGGVGHGLAKTINAIAAGLEEECLNCMDANKSIIRDCIQEQLYSGMDGTDRCLSPTYDNDPYFNEPGPWQNKPEKYKRSLVLFRLILPGTRLIEIRIVVISRAQTSVCSVHTAI